MMKKRSRANGIWLAFGLCLSACAVMPDQVPIGGPPEYRAGFAAGCNSGYTAAGNIYYRFDKDPQRFLDDKLYAQGWGDGFGSCKANYEAFDRRF